MKHFELSKSALKKERVFIHLKWNKVEQLYVGHLLSTSDVKCYEITSPPIDLSHKTCENNSQQESIYSYHSILICAWLFDV